MPTSPPFRGTYISSSKVSGECPDYGFHLRGFPISNIIKEEYSLEQVIFLVLQGELPSTAQLKSFMDVVSSGRNLNSRLRELIRGTISGTGAIQVVESVLILAKIPKKSMPYMNLDRSIFETGYIMGIIIGAMAYMFYLRKEGRQLDLGAFPSLGLVESAIAAGDSDFCDLSSEQRRLMIRSVEIVFISLMEEVNCASTLAACNQASFDKITRASTRPSNLPVAVLTAWRVHRHAHYQFLCGTDTVNAPCPGCGRGMQFGEHYQEVRRAAPVASQFGLLASAGFRSAPSLRNRAIAGARELSSGALGYWSSMLLQSLDLRPSVRNVMLSLCRFGGWAAHYYEELRSPHPLRDPPSRYIGHPPRRLKSERSNSTPKPS